MDNNNNNSRSPQPPSTLWATLLGNGMMPDPGTPSATSAAPPYQPTHAIPITSGAGDFVEVAVFEQEVCAQTAASGSVPKDGRDVSAQPWEERIPFSYILYNDRKPVLVSSKAVQLGCGYCDFVVTQRGGVSGKHCELVVLGETLFVKNLSQFGTYIKAVRDEEYVLLPNKQNSLLPGDTLCLINPYDEHAEQYSWTVSTPMRMVGDYILTGPLGSGAFHQGQHCFSEKDVAIDVVNNCFGWEMKMFDHKNIVRIFEKVEMDGSTFFIQELVPDGNLFDYLNTRRCPFNEVEARNLFVQLVDAVSHMHSKSVAHRDLKPENVLVKVVDSPSSVADNASPIPGQKVILKVTGFGAAARYEKATPINFSMDVWSLGMILVRLLSFKPTLDASDVADLKISGGCRDLLERLLKTDPRDRIGLDGIKAHEWLKGCVNGGRLAKGSERSRDEEQAEDTTTFIPSQALASTPSHASPPAPSSYPASPTPSSYPASPAPSSYPASPARSSYPASPTRSSYPTLNTTP